MIARHRVLAALLVVIAVGAVSAALAWPIVTGTGHAVTLTYCKPTHTRSCD